VASSCGSNGATCTDDADCCSGWVCDNDGVGLEDDNSNVNGICFTPTNNFFQINDPDYTSGTEVCEYRVYFTQGVFNYFADERAPYESAFGGSDGCPSDSHCGVGPGCEAVDRDNILDACESAGVGQGSWIDTSGAVYNGEGVDSDDCTNNVECGNNDFTDGFCCGDDNNENYRSNNIDGVNYIACCSDSNGCVDENGVCQEGNEGESYTGTCDWDGLDNNCDGDTDWDFADGIHGDINCQVSIESNPSITGGLAPE
jgi:hypothetical protein